MLVFPNENINKYVMMMMIIMFCKFKPVMEKKKCIALNFRYNTPSKYSLKTIKIYYSLDVV